MLVMRPSTPRPRTQGHPEECPAPKPATPVTVPDLQLPRRRHHAPRKVRPAPTGAAHRFCFVFRTPPGLRLSPQRGRALPSGSSPQRPKDPRPRVCHLLRCPALPVPRHNERPTYVWGTALIVERPCGPCQGLFQSSLVSIPAPSYRRRTRILPRPPALCKARSRGLVSADLELGFGPVMGRFSGLQRPRFRRLTYYTDSPEGCQGDVRVIIGINWIPVSRAPLLPSIIVIGVLNTLCPGMTLNAGPALYLR